MLKNDIPELALFYDLEWVPDAAGAVRLYNLPNDTTEIDAIQHLWEKTNGYNAETMPRPFVKYILSKVVSIAFLSRKVVYDSNRVKTIEFAINSLPKLPVESADVNEAEIIERFLYIVGKTSPQLVGYNSSESDIQVLIQRGIVNEITAPLFNERPAKPWEGRDYFDSRNSEWHLDLVKYFAFQHKPRLDEIASLCGFPGKIDVNGGQVVDLWLERDLKKIIEYNRVDTFNTYLVWLRFVYFAGKLTEQEYQEEMDTFRIFLDEEADKPDGEYITAFIEKWDE